MSKIHFILGSARRIPLEDNSIQTCITSPPYFGLRNYGTAAQVWGGDEACGHEWNDGQPRYSKSRREDRENNGKHGFAPLDAVDTSKTGSSCQKCGAWRGELGNEPTVELFVQHIVEVFREVRRVLRPDGTCFLNIATSYSSGTIESNESIIKRKLPNEFRRQIAQALSKVWSGYASPEQALLGLLAKSDGAARELHRTALQKMRPNNQGPQKRNKNGIREILLPKLREVGKSDKKAQSAKPPLSNVRGEIAEIPIGYKKERQQAGILQSGLLVCVQPERQSLSLDRGATWQDESRGSQVEARGIEEGQASLQDMPIREEAGGASYKTICEPRAGTMAGEQWGDAVSRLPCEIQASGNGELRDAGIHSERSGSGLEDISFHSVAIPAGFEKFCEPRHVIKPKDDVLVPERLILALQQDGWTARQTIIWQKPNCMPSSVTDRPTTDHEYIFLLTKSARYYYDSDAIREPITSSGGACFGPQTKGGFKRTEDGGHGKLDDGSMVQSRKLDSPEQRNHPLGRNKRSVWRIPTASYKNAHFATFPAKLVDPMVRAGTSEKGCCPHCRRPWKRIVDRSRTFESGSGRSGNAIVGKSPDGIQGGGETLDLRRGPVLKTLTIGWQPTCDCPDHSPVPCRVLDPFSGAATTGLVCQRLGREYIGVELKQEYIDMGRERLAKDLMRQAEGPKAKRRVPELVGQMGLFP